MNQILYNWLLNSTKEERLEILSYIYESNGSSLFSSLQTTS